MYTDFGNVPFRHDYGWKLLAHYYNQNIGDHGGNLEAVYTAKGETDIAFTRDYGSTRAASILPDPWQTDTCIGNFFYQEGLQYKSSDTIIRLLADIVSKNGNLLLSIPQRPDGTIDGREEKFLHEMAAWMAINGEAIFATKPFKVYGEGPARNNADGKQEGTYTPEDIRFTVKGDTLYAIVLGLPARVTTMKTLGSSNSPAEGEISGVSLLGYSGKLKWSGKPDGLAIQLPTELPCASAIVFAIKGLT